MSRASRRRGAIALSAAALLGGFAVASLSAAAARADDGSGPSAPPVSVTIPGVGSNTPTPTPTPSSQPSSPPSGGGGGYGGGGGGAGTGGGSTTAPHQPGTEPKVSKHPATGTIKVVVTPGGVLRSGDLVTVSAAGFDRGEKVQVVLYYEHGKPVKVGNFVVSAAGVFSELIALPRLDAGTDTIQLTGWNSSKVGTGTLTLGTSFVDARLSSLRTLWLWAGGLAGLAAFGGLVWFGIASFRQPAALEAQA